MASSADLGWTLVTPARSRAVLECDRQTAPQVLAARVVHEMTAAWDQGDYRCLEDFLLKYPDLGNHPPAALRVLQEEISLGRKTGLQVSCTDVVRRFPQWRDEVEGFFDALRLLDPWHVGPQYPEVGETLGDFHLVGELGRGAQGRVFLATQRGLADRPIVLKMTRCAGHEHLSLARLQHTHIVPLYSVQDFPARNLRVLYLPFLGGATWAQVLEKLHGVPVRERTGRHVLDVIDYHTAIAPVYVRLTGPARERLARASYVEAVCWMGARLAETLHYAHQRGLVHLDVKPSNVLLAADGQPMILDFHIARQPLQVGDPPPDWLGGTPRYMSPEQRAVCEDLQGQRPISAPLDGRSDLYSLGVFLDEALGSPVVLSGEATPPLCRCNPQVSVGLSDIIDKCLAPDLSKRYATGAALAADLTHHLEYRPLRGVRNRSLAERWGKWRRRRPYLLPVLSLLLVLTASLVGLVAMSLVRAHELRQEAETAFDEGREQLRQRRFADAVKSLKRGLEHARDEDLRGALATHLRIARRAAAADELHQLAEEVRLCYLLEQPTPRTLHVLDAGCRKAWSERHLVLQSEGAALEKDVEQQIRFDLLDLAICWADLRLRLAAAEERDALRGEALRLLAEVEATLGATADAFLLGRSAWRSGDVEAASEFFAKAVSLQPHGFWPNFCRGLCAFRRQRFSEASDAFSVCIGARPGNAECFVWRGRARAAMAQWDDALADFAQALRLRPNLPEAFLHRGVAFLCRQRLAEARADLLKARACGAEEREVAYHLVLAHFADGEWRAGVADWTNILLDHGFAKD